MVECNLIEKKKKKCEKTNMQKKCEILSEQYRISNLCNMLHAVYQDSDCGLLAGCEDDMKIQICK